jgi:phosphoribosyl 1,2-cyclic phosphodiesterase
MIKREAGAFLESVNHPRGGYCVKLQYFGARGSLPTPGKSTIKYGGNTTCLLLQAGNRPIIVDGGSGLRLLGLELMKREFAKGQGEAVFCWTHFHWDHLMGFPFFIPNFIPGNKFAHFGPAMTREILVRQQQFITFPVEFDKMPSVHTFTTVEAGRVFKLGEVEVTSCAMNHPAGGLTYRFQEGGKKVVFATDVEHPETGIDAGLLALSQGADLLIYDSQYTPEEYSKGRKGWGHSTWKQGVELAKAAQVKRLHLCHHDQLHSDSFLERQILAPAKKQFSRTSLAREGWAFEL